MLLQAAQLSVRYIYSNFTIITWSITGIILLYYLLLFPFFISPLRKIPGPYFNRISGFRALNRQRTFNWISSVHEWHRKYGHVIILSPNEISVDGNSSFINDIYIKNFPKSSFYENFRNHGFKDNIFASLENDRHLRYKKLIMGLYSKSAIFSKTNRIRSILVQKTAYLVKDIYTSSVTAEVPDIINAKSELNEFGMGHEKKDGKWFNPSGKARNIGIDVYSLFASLAMDVVSSFEVGKDNGTDFLNHPAQRHMIIKHRIQASMVFWTTLMPRFWNWAASKSVLEASKEVEEWQLNLYNNAEKNVPKFNDDENMTTLETLKKNGFKGTNAYTFLSDNIFAGHETTAISLAYLTYELSRPVNFSKQELLHQELYRTFGKPSTVEDNIDDLEAVDKLPYLSALLDENLRVHASIPGAEPRIVDRPYNVKLEDGSQIKIPLGTTISCQVYSMHRNSTVFPDPYRFIPERWLKYDNESESNYSRRITKQQKHMMPFGKGIRMCLGMNIALIEMKLAIANLYWHFNSKICPDWCKITEYEDDDKSPRPIEIGVQNMGNNVTDEEKMVMNDAYTTRPINDECWLEWYENS